MNTERQNCIIGKLKTFAQERFQETGKEEVVIWEFDGAGDSGYIYDPNGDEQTLNKLREVVKDSWELDAMLPGGWEISEGGRGTVTLYIQEDPKIKTEVYTRYYEESFDESEY